MQTVLKIGGMTCGHCSARVEKALAGVEGVESVSVDLKKKEAAIEGTASLEALIAAVEDAGYDAKAAGAKAKKPLLKFFGRSK